MSWVVVALIQYINGCHSENVHFKTNFKRGWQERWLVRKQLSASFFVGFVWYGESREREWPTAELVSYIFAWFTYFNMQCVQREIRKGFCYWVLLGILYAIVWMRSINWTSRRSQGYPLLAAGLLIPTRRKLRLFWYLQKKLVKVCIRSSYREYPPLKPKNFKKKCTFFDLLSQVFWRLSSPKFYGGFKEVSLNKMQDASQASTFTVRWGQPVNQAVQTCRSSTSHLANCTLVSELGGCRLGECHWVTRIRNWMES